MQGVRSGGTHQGPARMSAQFSGKAGVHVVCSQREGLHWFQAVPDSIQSQQNGTLPLVLPTWQQGRGGHTFMQVSSQQQDWQSCPERYACNLSCSGHSKGGANKQPYSSQVLQQQGPGQWGLPVQRCWVHSVHCTYRSAVGSCCRADSARQRATTSKTGRHQACQGMRGLPTARWYAANSVHLIHASCEGESVSVVGQTHF
jgi:hypothetical protein